MKAQYNSHFVTPRDSQAFRDLFTDALQEIYWTEKTLIRALPDLIEGSGTDSLANTLSDHLAATREQVDRLEEVFLLVGEKINDKKCEAMQGLLLEAEKMMLEREEGLVREAAIISAIQKIVHYEIACYGTLCAFAQALEEKEAASLLHYTLEEEKEADELLSAIAESMQMELVDTFDDYIDLSDSARDNSKGSPADFR